MSATINRATLVRMSAILASLLMISLLVVTGSRAAFTASTDNATNTFSSASTITLTDDDNGATLFTVTGLTPGARVENCIEVTFAGASANADIRMYTGAFTTGDLDPALNIEVTIGSGASFAATETGPALGGGDCSDFVAGTFVFPMGPLALFETNASYVTAVPAWNTSNTSQGNVQVYRIVVEMDATAGNAFADKQSGEVTFVWEAQG